MGYRPNIDGMGMALSCDKTTTGSRLIPSLPVSLVNILGFGVIRMGDCTTACPKCGKVGRVIEGTKAYHRTFMGIQVEVDRCEVMCGCPQGSNRIITPVRQWLGDGPSPRQIEAEKQAALLAQRKISQEVEEKQRVEERDRNRVFAKSCLRGEGCNDAGDAPEPHTHLTTMAYYQTVQPADPVSNNDVAQHATKKSVEEIPAPKK